MTYNSLMPTLFIPAPIRDLTQGKASVVVTGSSVREALESLEREYPGIKERLCDGDKIRPNISVMVNGHVSHLKMREKLTAVSEVHFVIAISGG
jgi:molybdopterin synthase sulfur carrier subunit